MEKEELIQLLKNYKENKARLNIKLKDLKSARIKLKYCEDAETSITSLTGVNQDIQSKNKISNKVLNKVIKNAEEREKIEEKITKLEDEVKILRSEVDEVDDRLMALKYKEEKLVRAYYIDGRTYEDIGNNLYFELFSQTRSGKQIKRTIEIAIEKMVKL